MINFNRPAVTGSELNLIAQAMLSGHLSGDGSFTKQSSAILEEITGAKKALLTTSCTHALEMTALLLEPEKDDEIILPSFTFVSTANAYVLRGARPVFADIRPDTLNIDENSIERLITPRTKAIIVVHYAGVSCKMDRIMDVANSHGIPVIEDNAHGLFGCYKNRPLGSFGSLATLSFHETKNITCGEGGALLINDPKFIERAEIIREKGTNRSRFFRGQIDKYSWVDIGSSYLPSELLAAYLLAQLQSMDSIQEKRQQIWHRYDEELRQWAQINGIKQPTVPQECEQPAHLYYLLSLLLKTVSRASPICARVVSWRYFITFRFISQIWGKGSAANKAIAP